MKLVLLDNYDSFTFNLRDYFFRLKQDCTVVRNDEWDDAYLSSPECCLVISPGPKTPQEAGCTMDVIHRYHQTVPMLGVCLGMQAIGLYFGMNLMRSKEPKHGKTSKIKHNNSGIFEGIPQHFEAMRYHSLMLEIEKLPPDIKIDAQSEDDHCAMALHHSVHPITAVQFHPESILTASGIDLLRNWLILTNSKF